MITFGTNTQYAEKKKNLAFGKDTSPEKQTRVRIFLQQILNIRENKNNVEQSGMQYITYEKTSPNNECSFSNINKSLIFVFAENCIIPQEKLYKQKAL